jgi:hypothetical protein
MNKGSESFLENVLEKHFWPIVATLVWLESAFFTLLRFAAPDQILEYIFWPSLGLLLVTSIYFC